MSKSTMTYWNTLAAEHQGCWQTMPNTAGLVEQLILAVDHASGDYTRFEPGADTNDFGAACHDYPEEVFIISGRLYDGVFDLWLEAGHYASRPPGEQHGPFKTDIGCLVLEISYPSQAQS